MPSHGTMVRDGQLGLNMPWCGTAQVVLSMSMPSHHGTMVQDGQLGLNTPSWVMWDSSGRPIYVHAIPWYNGTGWTVGTQPTIIVWDSLCSPEHVHAVPWYNGMGWTVGTQHAMAIV